MALMDHAVTTQAPNQELRSFARQQMSAQTVQRHLQQYGLLAWRSWLRLLLTLHHRQEHAENVQLFSLPARSPVLSPTENVWSMVAKRLACHHMAVTTFDELWHRVEAAWFSVPVYAIQSLLNSMSRYISTVIIARGGCPEY
ncbi:hypothetical protein TNCV_138801 [Trichonephila clavipes]|nr:hypothetical protein TNCV_138801 [Trichonephila clavipes]